MKSTLLDQMGTYQRPEAAPAAAYLMELDVLTEFQSAQYLGIPN